MDSTQPARWLTALVCVLAAALVGPATAQAATWASYANQAAAQQAADTHDGDGDGIYCEALPCPCLKPGDGSAPPAEAPPVAPTPGAPTAPTPGTPPEAAQEPTPAAPPAATEDPESTKEANKPAKGKSKKTKSKKTKRSKTPKRSVLKGVTITRVIDGDTVRAKLKGGGTVTVRLIGIDAPEASTLRSGSAECGGTDATTALETFRVAHASVRLITDPLQDRYDQYGRLLAYIEPTEREPGDPRTYQQWMLSQGWANVYEFGRGFARLRAFTQGADRASRVGVGAWTACGGDFRLPLG